MSSHKPKEPVVPSPEIEQLYAQVYADPDDDGARLVLSDALIERRDPHGELIAIQFGKGRGASEMKKEAKLLRQFRNKWLGPIAACVSSDTIFERGFPSRCWLVDGVGARALAGAREWSTFRFINAEGVGPRRTVNTTAAFILLGEPVRRWARTIEGVQGPCSEQVLASTEIRRWRSLSLKAIDANHLLTLASRPDNNMPELRHLEMHCDPTLRAESGRTFFHSPVGAQLDVLTLRDDESDAPLAIVSATKDLFSGGGGPARVVLAGRAGSVTIDVRPGASQDREHAGLVTIGAIKSPLVLAGAIAGLAGAPIRNIRIVNVTYGDMYRTPKGDRDMKRLQEAAEHIGPVTMDSIP